MRCVVIQTQIQAKQQAIELHTMLKWNFIQHCRPPAAITLSLEALDFFSLYNFTMFAFCMFARYSRVRLCSCFWSNRKWDFTLLFVGRNFLGVFIVAHLQPPAHFYCHGSDNEIWMIKNKFCWTLLVIIIIIVHCPNRASHMWNMRSVHSAIVQCIYIRKINVLLNTKYHFSNAENEKQQQFPFTNTIAHCIEMLNKTLCERTTIAFRVYLKTHICY